MCPNTNQLHDTGRFAQTNLISTSQVTHIKTSFIFKDPAALAVSPQNDTSPLSKLPHHQHIFISHFSTGKMHLFWLSTSTFLHTVYRVSIQGIFTMCFWTLEFHFLAILPNIQRPMFQRRTTLRIRR